MPIDTPNWITKKVLHKMTVVGFGLLCLQPSLALAQEESAVDSWGKDLFTQHCAACHGPNATGDGPMADTLKKPPSDLTQLSKKNGGSFPRAEVMRFIDGERPVPSHGSRDMPIWGEVFRREKTNTEARMRIFSLASYIESLQQD